MDEAEQGNVGGHLVMTETCEGLKSVLSYLLDKVV
jgi:hypothetical protein